MMPSFIFPVHLNFLILDQLLELNERSVYVLVYSLCKLCRKMKSKVPAKNKTKNGERRSLDWTGDEERLFIEFSFPPKEIKF